MPPLASKLPGECLTVLPRASPSVASALRWRFLVTCDAGKMLCKTEHEYYCEESQNRVSGPIIERCELDLLRELIRSESVTFIGSNTRPMRRAERCGTSIRVMPVGRTPFQSGPQSRKSPAAFPVVRFPT